MVAQQSLRHFSMEMMGLAFSVPDIGLLSLPMFRHPESGDGMKYRDEAWRRRF